MPLMSLNEVCSLITDGTHYTPPDVGAGICFVTVKDIQKDGSLDFEGCSKISPDEYQKAAAGNSAPRLGDVLFSKDGTVGKVGVVRDERQFAVLSSIAILRPDPDLMDSDYLGHVLRSEGVLDQALKKKTGSAIRRIILSDLKGVRFFVPAIPEQRRIAAILDKADALRAKRREAIAKLDLLLRTVFLDAFGDPVTNSKGWVLAGLADVTEFQEGPGILAKDFRESGIPLIRMAGLNAGHVSLKGCNFIDSEMVAQKWQHFRLIEGDILVLTSASFGNPAVVDAEAAGGIFYTGIIRFKPSTDKVDAYFLKSFLASMWFSRQANAMASGAVIKHFGPTHLRQMKMPVPPLALQNEYVRCAQRIEEMIASFKVSSLFADQLFESLQQRAFAGML